MKSIKGYDLCGFNVNNSNSNCLTLKCGIFDDLQTTTTVASTPVWNPVALTEPFAEATWNPLSTTQGSKSAIQSIAKFTIYDQDSKRNLIEKHAQLKDEGSFATRYDLVSEKLPAGSVNIVVTGNQSREEICPSGETKATSKTFSNVGTSFADSLFSIILPNQKIRDEEVTEAEEPSPMIISESNFLETSDNEDVSMSAYDGDFWEADVEDNDGEGSAKVRDTEVTPSFLGEPLTSEIDCIPKALIMKFAESLPVLSDKVDEEEDGKLLEHIIVSDALLFNTNNNSSILTASNVNINAEPDPTAKFQSLSTQRAGSNHLYQPSAISATVSRQGPFERYQYQAKTQCRVGGGPPGVPAAGGYHSTRPATREGLPWGTRKERRRPLKAINQEPYQTLKPSGNWMHGTKQKQPANKQAQATRVMAYPYYLPDNQKCKSRPQYHSKQAASGLTGSCTDVKLRKERKIDMDKVRCNCPGLYEEHSSHGPGNFWDEEEDDEHILAGMCQDDMEEECGQGQDGIFPLEEWADEWEDGITSGECGKSGKLAPGTLELRPWENPCLEELQKRKRRIQELRNKRWRAITRAKDKAERIKQDADASEEEKKKAQRHAEKVYNDYSQKSWSLLGWFNPVNWASSSGTGCGEPETNREGKTTTVRSTRGGPPSERRGSTPAMNLKSVDSCPNNFYPKNASGHNCSANNANVDAIVVDARSDVSTNDNQNDNNCCAAVVEPCLPQEASPKGIRKGKRNATQALEEYEWESADDSAQDYDQKLAASGLKSRNDVNERVFRMEVDQAKRKRKLKKEQEAKRLREAAEGAGILANIWGYFTGSTSAKNPNQLDLAKANVNANSDATVEANANNNAANRCVRPCPPCPQGDCEPPPFECPCNDVSCPKKLKPKNDNLDDSSLNVQLGSSSVNIKRGENDIVDVEIDLKKPRPDLALGCPCGDEKCKKKFCNQPPPPPKRYSVCERAKGPMAKQEICPDPEERDICDTGHEAPKTCPCADEFCPNKPGGEGYFKFLYPPNDKMKYSDEGCPDEQQIECWVLPNGQVKCKPILSPLHCEVVPPCPCDEWEKKEFDSCDCSGNAWGEEADDENLDGAECGAPPAEDDNDCGHQQVPGGLGKVDEYEWDQEDVPCVDLPPDADESTKELLEAMKECDDYMAYRNKKTGIMQAAMEAALEAWKLDKMRKEKEKGQEEARKRKIEAFKNEGLDDEEIYDLMCVVGEMGQCDIVGDYPIQEACVPPPNDPPGCPCPDLMCPKRATFDHQMFDLDMSKYKTKKEIKAANNYYSSDAYKTMECELKAPTYKDVGKGYPPAKQCPCPNCKTEEQKAWAEVEKMKVGPPPECPCQDLKCPKKPPKTEEEEVEMESSPCHMRGRYPKQSGCLEVLRCELIKDPCNPMCVRPEDKRAPPKEEFRCHACSLRKPMPKQSSCPDYDCQECRLVCDDCGCKPVKCEKCESAKPVVKQEENLCAPCTVPRPFPKQSSCKQLHPCDPEHPCMCDPGSGEAIDAERCGPCDTRNHAVYPEQFDCPNAVSEETAKECDPKGEINDALNKKKLKAMKLVDTRTGFGFLDGQATVTCDPDETGNCKQGECGPGLSEVTINLSDATKARLMPGNPAVEGVIEGRAGKFKVDANKIQELADKKKVIDEPQVKCVRVIDYEASSNDLGIIDTEKAQKKKTVNKAVKNFRKSLSTLPLADIEEGKKLKNKVAKPSKDMNNNADLSNDESGVIVVESLAPKGASEVETMELESEASLVVEDIEMVDVMEEEVRRVEEVAEAEGKAEVVGASVEEEMAVVVAEKEATLTQSEEVVKAPEESGHSTELQMLLPYRSDALSSEESMEGKQQQQPPAHMISPSQQEAEENCLHSCLFSGLDSPNIIMKKSQQINVSDMLPNEMRPKMKCREPEAIIDRMNRPAAVDKPPTIDLCDAGMEEEPKVSRRPLTRFSREVAEVDSSAVGLNSLLSRNNFSSSSSSASPAATSGLASAVMDRRMSSAGIYHRSATVRMSGRRMSDLSGSKTKKTPSQELFLVETDENGAKVIGSVDYAELASGAKREISNQFSESAAIALEEGSVNQSVELLSQAILSHPEPKSFLERLGIRNFLPSGLWSSD